MGIIIVLELIAYHLLDNNSHFFIFNFIVDGFYIAFGIGAINRRKHQFNGISSLLGSDFNIRMVVWEQVGFKNTCKRLCE